MKPLIAATATAVVIYAMLCWVVPFGRCRRCSGRCQYKTLITGRLRPCRRCKTSGLRLRVGRRVWNFGRRLYKPLVAKRRARAAA